MAHNLQPKQAPRNSDGPQEKEQADDPEARSLQGQSSCGWSAAADGLNGCGHFSF
jgi:hypothetical protein